MSRGVPVSQRAPPASLPPNERWEPAVTQPLRGQVALVAGATRGAGRAIAVSLGLAGATVYATGRSVRGHPATEGRPETVTETAEIIRAYGGRAYGVRVDHTEEREVRRLLERIRRSERGRLDLLVNDIWGGEELTQWGRPPWKMDYRLGRTMVERGVLTHLLTSRYALPLMVRRRRGLVLEVTDGDHQEYRGSIYYDLVKTSVIRLALAQHAEFEEAGLRTMSALAVTPGFLRSEFMLEQFGVTEANWWDAARRVRRFEFSETPYFLGRAVVALATDPNVHAKSGKVYGTWTLAKEYRFTDRDGSRPDWGRVFAAAARGG